jgi:hypothetical protein
MAWHEWLLLGILVAGLIGLLVLTGAFGDQSGVGWEQ